MQTTCAATISAATATATATAPTISGSAMSIINENTRSINRHENIDLPTIINPPNLLLHPCKHVARGSSSLAHLLQNHGPV